MTRPLDARGVDPCLLLSEAQKRDLGVDVATEEPLATPAVRRCRWDLGDYGVVQVSIGEETAIPGLSGLYVLRRIYSLFEPAELAGYPIVRAERGEPVDDLHCTIYIGAADDQLVSAAVAASSDSRPSCEIARRLAEFMISNLPPLG